MKLRTFGLWQLLTFVALIAVFMELGALLYHRAAERDAAIADVQQQGGRVELAYSGPAWLDHLGASRLRRYVVGLTFDAADENDRAGVDSDLRKFPDLQWLDLGSVPIDDEGMCHVAELKGLQKLTFNTSSVTAAGFAKIAALRDLQELNISGCTINNAAIRQLANSPSLRSLLLRSALVENELTELAKLPRLKRLDLANCRFAFEMNGLHTWLGQLDTLEELYLQDWPIQPGDIAGLSRLKNLRVLDLTGCDVSLNELQSLAHLPRLEYLGLAPRVVDDQAIQILKGFRTLRKLSLHPGNIIRLNAEPVTSNVAVEQVAALLNGTADGTPGTEAEAPDPFLQVQLPRITKSLLTVSVDTAPPTYPGIRGAPGPRVLYLPALVDEKDLPAPSGGGVF